MGVKLSGCWKPEYLFQPGRLLRRLTPWPAAPSGTDFILPWGVPVTVRPTNALGRALRRFGVYDLAVSETLWRLTDAGETVVDVGANIGYTTAVVVARLEGRGTVICIEPHPGVFRELESNVARWRRLWPGVRLECFPVALSDVSGTVRLREPPGFERDWTSAKVDGRLSEHPGVPLDVPSATLDHTLAHMQSIHVLKVDVEGHEANVLSGARTFLQQCRVRDVIFEDHRAYPTPASDILEQYGYNVRRIQKTFGGPRLIAPDAATGRSSWEPTSFLATRDWDRAEARLQRRGWSIIGRHRVGAAVAGTGEAGGRRAEIHPGPTGD